ncbi:trehalose-phosphatase [Alkalilimnicola ehrlichii]|uniref:Trehalose 6-phosphate phosphatase n=1 Tax=Alkalilimnicola ehrlichii TaxID=351052 RepID=A0A3E0X2D3_9GAMM|nr:trehalose-phosphatase [Alkalilimnicola ehrlichii]RFA38660.1 trehalose-phosphatase [Alkalilimnicola ehrlichii]
MTTITEVTGLASTRAVTAAVVDRLRGHTPFVCLDFDGTLAPIANDPATIELSTRGRAALIELSHCFPVAIVSGRAIADLKARIPTERLYFAGNHGLEIEGPGLTRRHAEAIAARRELQRAYSSIQHATTDIEGVLIEDKGLTLSVHYRQTPEFARLHVARAVDRAVVESQNLRKHHGKCVYELRPAVDWHKGAAVEYLRSAIERKTGTNLLPLYVGDDCTDEDAFAVLNQGRGVSILVADAARPTAAEYLLPSPDAVHKFLENLLDELT